MAKSEGGKLLREGVPDAFRSVPNYALFRYLLLLPLLALGCSESSDPSVSSTASGGTTSDGSGGSGTGGVAGTGAAGTGAMIGSLNRFESASPLVLEGTWRPGAPISIQGRNGNIEVIRGTGEVVRAVFTPFVYRSSNTPESEVASDLAKLLAEVQQNASGVSGAVLVRSSRANGSPSTLGADIVVEIPPAFDSDLSIHQDNGETDLSFAGNAKAITLESGNGRCNVACSAVATALNVFCQNGDLAVDVPEAPAGSDVRTIGTELGNIAISFAKVPAAQRFSVQADARGGTVQITGGSTCQVQDISAGSKIVSCHGTAPGDPVYQVNANDQSDVLLTF